MFRLRKNVIETNNSIGVPQQTTITITVNATDAAAANGMQPAKQEEGSPELLDNDDQPPAGGGGLVGIITSLSGVSMSN